MQCLNCRLSSSSSSSSSLEKMCTFYLTAIFVYEGACDEHEQKVPDLFCLLWIHWEGLLGGLGGGMIFFGGGIIFFGRRYAMKC